MQCRLHTQEMHLNPAQQRSSTICSQDAPAAIHRIGSSLPHRTTHARRTGVPPAPAAFPVLRRCYGGPVLLGTGLGIVSAEAHLVLDAPALDPALEAEKARRRLVHKLVNGPRAWLLAAVAAGTVDEATRREVEDTRLRIRLGRFWGLVKERGRPWQRDVLVHLCLRLPPEVAQAYRTMRPATMQRVLAQRAKAERCARLHLAELRDHCQAIALWLRRTQRASRGAAPPVSRASLVEAAGQLLSLSGEAGTTLYMLRVLKNRAVKMGDSDYAQHAGALEPLVAACVRRAMQLRESHLRPILAASAAIHRAASNRRGGNSSDGHRDIWHGDPLGHRGDSAAVARTVALLPEPPVEASAQLPAVMWRYPPVHYLPEGDPFRPGEGAVGSSTGITEQAGSGGGSRAVEANQETRGRGRAQRQRQDADRDGWGAPDSDIPDFAPFGVVDRYYADEAAVHGGYGDDSWMVPGRGTLTDGGTAHAAATAAADGNGTWDAPLHTPVALRLPVATAAVATPSATLGMADGHKSPARRAASSGSILGLMLAASDEELRGGVASRLFE